MSKSREICDFLEDAISAMEKAERFVAGMSFEEFFFSGPLAFQLSRELLVRWLKVVYIRDIH